MGTAVVALALTAPAVAMQQPDGTDGDARKAALVPRATGASAVDRAQEPLLGAASTIAATVRANQLHGYHNIRISPESGGLTLYWHGPVPATVGKLLANFESQGITTRVEQTRYSPEKLRHARGAILANSKAGKTRISTVSIRTDGGGLTVGVDGSLDVARELIATKHLEVPVSLVEQPLVDPLLGRYNDEAPFWGGAAYINRDSCGPTGCITCSTGFGVHNDSDATEKALLTAGHCMDDGFPEGDEIWTYDPLFHFQQRFLGTTNEERFPTLDAGFIETDAGRCIYTGGIDPDFTHRCVADYDINPVGMRVWMSGAYSGARGSIEVKDNSITWQIVAPDGINIWTVVGVMAEQVNRQNAQGQGDSGGPAYTIRSDGQVIARGILSAGDTDTRVDCTGVQGDRRCYWRIYYSAITRILVQTPYAINK